MNHFVFARMGVYIQSVLNVTVIQIKKSVFLTKMDTDVFAKVLSVINAMNVRIVELKVNVVSLMGLKDVFAKILN
jgi:hypothetical protein